MSLSYVDEVEDKMLIPKSLRVSLNYMYQCLVSIFDNAFVCLSISRLFITQRLCSLFI